MTDEEQMLTDLADEMVRDASNSLLDAHIDKANTWVAKRGENGQSATLNDFIRKVSREPNKRHIIIAAYCAALWRLMGRDR